MNRKDFYTTGTLEWFSWSKEAWNPSLCSTEMDFVTMLKMHCQSESNHLGFAIALKV